MNQQTNIFNLITARCSLGLLILILNVFILSESANAQDLPEHPTNKAELARKIFTNWAELSSSTIDGILFSDSNLQIRRYVEAIVVGESPEVLNAHLRDLKLDESSQERILIELVKELRKHPDRLSELHKDIRRFNEYQPFMDAKSSLGSGVFNSAILAVDFTAIWYGTAAAADTLAKDFMYSYQTPTIVTAAMMLIGSGIIAEVINMRRSAGELVREWRKKRRKISLAKKIQSELKFETVFSDDRIQDYLTSQEIEKASAELLPHLLAKMNKDGQTSWRARRKTRSFSKSLKSNFSNEELERMGLYGLKRESKLSQFKLKVPLIRWFFKKTSEQEALLNVSDRDNYRRALSKLSANKVELRDTSRKTNFFLLNNFSIGMITIASAVQGLSLAVNSAAPGVISFDGALGAPLMYLKNFEPIVTVLTISAIALSLDFQGMFNTSYKRNRARLSRIEMREENQIFETSLRKEGLKGFHNTQPLKASMSCSSFL